MPSEDRGHKQDEQEGGQKDPDRGYQRSPEARHQVTDERCSDHHWPRTKHADRDSEEKLVGIEPTALLHQSFLQKWHDNKATTKRETACFKKEDKQLAKRRGGRRWRVPGVRDAERSGREVLQELRGEAVTFRAPVRLFFVLGSLFFLLFTSVLAQVEMPDPSAIAGTPLPAPELPAGTVTVRVVRHPFALQPQS